MIRSLPATTIAGVIICVSAGPAPSAVADPNEKYNQTWTKPYDKTTCQDYRSQMTGKQTWAMAADMLTGLRNMKKKTGLPPDDMVSDFASQMATACEPSIAATQPMTDIGISVFMLDSALKAPHFQP